MRKFLTSQTLASLRSFAAAARHLSFRRAASELNITQSAVSQQIKHLEDALGCPLFERLARALDCRAAHRRSQTLHLVARCACLCRCAPEAEWKHWLDAVGARTVDPSGGQFFTLANMSLEAALRDQGVALGRASLVEELLQRRELVALFKTPVKSRARYCLVYRKERATQRGMSEVMAWLRAQATAARKSDDQGTHPKSA